MKVTADKENEAAATEEPGMLQVVTHGEAGFSNSAPPTDNEDLFPAFKIPYSIELGPKNPWLKAADLFHAGIYDGKKFQVLEPGSLLVVIGDRSMMRKEVTDETGEKSYERAYKAFGEGYDATDKRYEELLAEAGGKPSGTSYILGVITPGGVAFAELQACKSAAGYWGKTLYQAKLSAGQCCKVLIGDHTENLVSSAQGQYLASKMFKQWKLELLTKEHVTALQAAFTPEIKRKFEAWTKR